METIILRFFFLNIFKNHFKVEACVPDFDVHAQRIFEGAGFDKKKILPLIQDSREKKAAYHEYWTHYPEMLRKKHSEAFRDGRVIKYVRTEKSL